MKTETIEDIKREIGNIINTIFHPPIQYFRKNKSNYKLCIDNTTNN